MGLKRKRSMTSLSPSSTTSSASVSPNHDASSPTPFSMVGWPNEEDDISMGGIEFGGAFNGGFTAPFAHAGLDIGSCGGEDAHLHSRTRKRFRDNRPDETSIHESTLSKLFLAQRPSHAPTPSPIPSTIPRPSSMSSTTSARSQQASLHSFWAIPHRPTTSPSTNFTPPAFASLNHTADLANFGGSFSALENRRKCEDCDSWMGAGEGMDLDMDGMGGEGEDCRSCGRTVCAMCAVVEVGVGRECLGCKTRPRRLAGGIGWVV
ncbi:MAG: hypothetical protein MMC23_000833 [Stictis urceolatum]|nr:hypothetical protein [Stictis urceolata]